MALTRPRPARWAARMGISTPLPDDAMIDAIAEFGFKILSVSPEIGWPGWSQDLARIVDRAHGHGMKVHFTAQLAGHDYRAPMIQAFGDGCRTAAAMGVYAISTLNEPNNKVSFWKGPWDPTGAAQAAFVSAGIRGATAENKDILTMVGAMTPYGPDDGGLTTVGRWPWVATGNILARLSPADKALLRGLGIHPYAYPEDPAWVWPEHPGWGARNNVLSTWVMLKMHGVRGRLYASEFGSTTFRFQQAGESPSHAEDRRAQHMQRTFDEFTNQIVNHGILYHAHILHTWQDGTGFTNENEKSMGIVDVNGLPKSPTWQVVHDMLTKPYPVAATTP